MTAATYLPGASYGAAMFRGTWNPVPDRYLVALYVGDYSATPVIYSPAASFPHRTLKAAARRLASLIHQQSKHGHRGAKFDCLYIVTPSGERLPLRVAQRRIAAGE